MLIVHHLQRSQSERIVWLCEELGIPYELRTYQRDAKTLLAPPELQQFRPRHPRRHHHPRRILHFANGYFQPALVGYSTVLRSGISRDDPSARFARRNFEQALRVLDDRLAKHTWLAGEEFTAADVMNVFTLTTARLFFPYRLAGYEGILGYLQRVSQREAYQTAMAKGDPGLIPLIHGDNPRPIRLYVTKTASGTVNSTADHITDQTIPGEYPSDDTDTKYDKPAPDISFSSIWSASKTWLFSLFPNVLDRFENWIKALVAWVLPPPRQAKMYEAILNRPIASSFIICQLVCCGVPLLVFLAGVFLFAAVAVLLWAVLSLLLAAPILLVASVMGVSLWGWGWVLYGLVKFIDQHFLGGVITRFWLANRQDQDGGDGPEGEGQKGEEDEMTGKDDKSEKKRPKKLQVKKDT
ncbi:hypothetical protein KXV64_008517 [Aspergillus fumigatus]|nr:hypothetical protein KXV94_007641 [Aspergillus fumigatus]KAH3537318.1 hypothetical protein KXV64_008517 [Aspergillus fumigatus]KAJ8181058.1 hypothetical protein LV157_006854 [Aspergillus fumigatus]